MLWDDISKFVICITFSAGPAQLSECRDIPRSMIIYLDPYQYKKIKPRIMFVIDSSWVSDIMYCCIHYIFCYTVGVGIHLKISVCHSETGVYNNLVIYRQCIIAALVTCCNALRCIEHIFNLPGCIITAVDDLSSMTLSGHDLRICWMISILAALTLT